MKPPDRVRLGRFVSGSGALCLTYDDGPGKGLTPRVMSALAARSARATFFLLGRRAEASPAVADVVKSSGHEIGCHSHDHLNAWKSPPWRSAADVERGYETLSRWLPEGCLFRPPYGKITPWTRRVAARRGSRVGWWTVDSGDTWERSPSVESVVERVAGAGGGVVLLHDFDRDEEGARDARPTGAADARADFVVRVTNALLDFAERESMRVMTLGAILDEMERRAKMAQ